MSATDTVCCSASDLYLSLVIFSNTALAFVFAQMAPHMSDSLSQPLGVTASGLPSFFPLFIVSAHPMPNVLLSRLHVFSICWIDWGMFIYCSLMLGFVWQKVYKPIQWKLQKQCLSLTYERASVDLVRKTSIYVIAMGDRKRGNSTPPKSCHPMIHVHTWLGGGSNVLGVMWCCKRNKIRSLFRVCVRICVCTPSAKKRQRQQKKANWLDVGSRWAARHCITQTCIKILLAASTLATEYVLQLNVWLFKWGHPFWIYVVWLFFCEISKSHFQRLQFQSSKIQNSYYSKASCLFD